MQTFILNDVYKANYNNSIWKDVSVIGKRNGPFELINGFWFFRKNYTYTESELLLNDLNHLAITSGVKVHDTETFCPTVGLMCNAPHIVSRMMLGYFHYFVDDVLNALCFRVQHSMSGFCRLFDRFEKYSKRHVLDEKTDVIYIYLSRVIYNIRVEVGFMTIIEDPYELYELTNTIQADIFNQGEIEFHYYHPDHDSIADWHDNQINYLKAVCEDTPFIEGIYSLREVPYVPPPEIVEAQGNNTICEYNFDEYIGLMNEGMRSRWAPKIIAHLEVSQLSRVFLKLQDQELTFLNRNGGEMRIHRPADLFVAADEFFYALYSFGYFTNHKDTYKAITCWMNGLNLIPIRYLNKIKCKKGVTKEHKIFIKFMIDILEFRNTYKDLISHLKLIIQGVTAQKVQAQNGDENENTPGTSQGIYQMFWNMGKSVINAGKAKLYSTLSSTTGKIKDNVEDFVSSIWNRIKKWAEEFKAFVMKHLMDYTWEKFKQHVPIVAAVLFAIFSVGICSLLLSLGFLTAKYILSFMCMILDYFIGSISVTRNFIANWIQKFFLSKPKDNEVEAQGMTDIVPRIVELSVALCGIDIKNRNFVDICKDYNAVHLTTKNFANSMQTIFSSAQQIFDYVYLMINGTYFFKNHQIFMEFEQLIEGWKHINSMENGQSKYRIKSNVDEVQNWVNSFERSIPAMQTPHLLTHAQMQVWAAMKLSYVTWRHELNNLGVSKTQRPEPVWIHLLGKPCTYKTALMNMLPHLVAQKVDFHFDQSQVYPRTMGSEYWEGYNGQWLVTYDDLYQSKDQAMRTMTSAELINVVSSTPCVVNMAGVESKGNTLFRSRLMISTTNELGFPGDLGVTDPNALKRRIHFAIHVEHPKEEKYPTNSAEYYRFLHSYDLTLVHFGDIDPNTNKERRTKITLSELVDKIGDRYNQNTNLANLMQNFVPKLDFIRAYEPISKEVLKVPAQGGDRHKFLSWLHDDAVYEDDEEWYEECVDFMSWQWLKMDEENYQKIINELGIRFPRMRAVSQRLIVADYRVTDLIFLLTQKGFLDLFKAIHAYEFDKKSKEERSLFARHKEADKLVQEFEEGIIVDDAHLENLRARRRAIMLVLLVRKDEIKTLEEVRYMLGEVKNYINGYWTEKNAIANICLLPGISKEEAYEFNMAFVDHEYQFDDDIARMKTYADNYGMGKSPLRHFRQEVREREDDPTTLHVGTQTIIIRLYNTFKPPFVKFLCCLSGIYCDTSFLNGSLKTFADSIEMRATIEEKEKAKSILRRSLSYLDQVKIGIAGGITSLDMWTGIKAFSALALLSGIVYGICYALYSTFRDNTTEAHVYDKRMIKHQQNLAHFGRFTKQAPYVSRHVEAQMDYEYVDAQGSEVASHNIRLMNMYMKNLIEMKVLFTDGTSRVGFLQMVKGRIGVAPRHIFVKDEAYSAQDVHGTVRQISLHGDEKFGSYHFSSAQFQLKFLENRDLMRIVFTSNLRPFTDITGHFYSFQSGDIVASPARLVPSPDGGPYYIKTGLEALSSRNLLFTVVKENGKEVKFKNFVWWKADIPGVKGECACPTITMDPSKNCMILGLHIGGDSLNSHIAPLYQSDFDDVTDNASISLISAQSQHPEIYDDSPIMKPMESVLATDQLKKKPFVSNKTSIVPSVFQTCKDGGPIYEVTKAPAQLGGPTQPLAKSLQKFNDVESPAIRPDMKAFIDSPEGRKFLNAGIMPKKHRAMKFYTLSKDHAAIGNSTTHSVDMNTSSGFIFMHFFNGKKKKELIHVNHHNKTVSYSDEFEEIWNKRSLLWKTGVLQTIVQNLLKDELRPLDRVEAGKTRLFFATDVESVIRYRMILGDFITKIEQGWSDSDVAVGVNPMSFMWKQLFEHVTVENLAGFLDGDFENFDRTGWRYEHAQSFYNWYKDYFMYSSELFEMETDETIKYIKNHKHYKNGMIPLHYLPENNIVWRMIMAIFHSHNINPIANYDVHSMMPSGHLVTTIFNTLFNSWIHRLAYWDLVVRPGYASLEDYDKYARGKFYGDDSFVAIAKRIAEYYNMIILSEWFTKVGMKYTTSSKGVVSKPFSKLEEVVFLKRSFTPVMTNNEITDILPRLDLETIKQSVLWTSKGSELYKKEATASACRSAAMELFFHGRQIYNQYVPQFNEVLLEYYPQGLIHETYDDWLERWQDGKWHQ